MEKKQTEKLKERLTEIAYIASATAVLNWDMETKMPPKGRYRQSAKYFSFKRCCS